MESKIVQAARAFIVSVCPDVIDYNSVLCDKDSEKQYERSYEDGLFAALLLSWRKYSQFIKYMSSLFHHMDVTPKQKNHTIMYVNMLAGKFLWKVTVLISHYICRKLCLTEWNSYICTIYQHALVTVLISKINKYREGKANKGEILWGDITLFRLAAQEMEGGMYETLYKTPYFNQIQTIYAEKKAYLINTSMDIIQYLSTVENLITTESELASNFLSSASLVELRGTILTILLWNDVDRWLVDCKKGFNYLIDTNNIEGMQACVKLLKLFEIKNEVILAKIEIYLSLKASQLSKMFEVSTLEESVTYLIDFFEAAHNIVMNVFAG